MKVTINYIKDEYGRVAVLPSQEREGRNADFAQSKGVDISGAKDNIDTVINSARLTGSMVTREFELRPYTYGEKINATRKSTSVVNGELAVDQSTLNLELLIASSGLKEAELRELPSEIAQTLISEMVFLSEPNADRLLFLLTPHTDGPVAEQTEQSR